jgi:hypothetical protein
VERVHRRPHAGDAAGHVSNQIVLVAIVDAEVRIAVPEEHGVDAAETPLEIVEEAVDFVPARFGIVERSVVNHEKVLDDRAVRPGELGTRVLEVVVACADQPLAPKVAQVREPPSGSARIFRTGNLAAERQKSRLTA